MKTSSTKTLRYLTVFAILFIGLSACEKHVTPNKVERKLADENWIVNQFIYFDTIVTDTFALDVFLFTEDGKIEMPGPATPQGTWSVGLNSDPTILYIGGYSQSPYNWFNNDWVVETVSKDQIQLKDETSGNQLVFSRKED